MMYVLHVLRVRAEGHTPTIDRGEVNMLCFYCAAAFAAAAAAFRAR
eukprot:COSAG06_NODE_3088_length_5874_cov_3.759391_1_plen_46_part_00